VLKFLSILKLIKVKKKYKKFLLHSPISIRRWAIARG
jgi:hypothetical protein